MEDKLLVEGLKVDLGKVTVVVNIYLDSEGRLEIVPLTRNGDIPDWSYVVGEDRDGELKLYSKYIGIDEED